MSPDLEFPDVTPEEYEKAGSKFATVGNHLSQLGMIEWETPGESIRFPFTIIEEGEDYGKESKIVAGVSAKALWKVKEMEKALGVELVDSSTGKVKIKEETIKALVGTQFLTIWKEQKDSRTAEEGGTGNVYTKATGALPLNYNEPVPAEESPF